MSQIKILGNSLPNIPWQEKPKNCLSPVWRYGSNPIINRNPVQGVARIFNSAVVPFEGAFIGVFRGETINGVPSLYLGRSKDGIQWEFDEERIRLVDENGELATDHRIVFDGQLAAASTMIWHE